jgi:hypothetical protein
MSKVARNGNSVEGTPPRSGKLGTVAILAVGTLLLLTWSVVLPVCGILYVIERLH